MSEAGVILEVRGLTTVFGGAGGFLRSRQARVRAVDDVSFEVAHGETVGIVGESGCGKTTLGRTLLGLIRETAGEIRLAGARVDGLASGRARAARRAIQYLHQDAAGSLDPWWSVGGLLNEAMTIAGATGDRNQRIEGILESVDLDPSVRGLYPHQLSGGQARRVALARLLTLKPQLVILDEPTAGLDLSVQATVLRLLRDVRSRYGLSCLLISHDMSVIRLMCDRVLVMYRGRVVETAPTQTLFRSPRHPYTRALLAATPRLAARAPAAALSGDVTTGVDTNAACGFAPRCRHALDACRSARPVLETTDPQALVACRRWREIGTPADAT